MLKKSLRLLWIEGAFFAAYDVWVGPVYLNGLAGELGVSIGLVALLSSVPWIGQVGQIFGVWALERTASYKRYTLITASAARALWALPLFMAAYWSGFMGLAPRGKPFPVTAWFLLTASCACCSQLISCTSGTSWMSWTRAILPRAFQGRFFGVKQRFSVVAVMAANVIAAVLVSWKPGGYRLGYGIQCALALASTFASVALLSQVPEAAVEAPRIHPRPLASILAEPLRDPCFRNFLWFAAAFNAAILISGPYFPYYFTKELKIPMSTVAVWLVFQSVGSFLAAGFWGKRIDRKYGRFSGAEWALWVGAHLMAISPLYYVPPSVSWVRHVGPIEYFLNGTGWVAFTIAMTTLLYRRCPGGKNAAYFSVYAAAIGISGAIAVFLGGELATLLTPAGGFRSLWFLSSLARLAVLWTLGRRLLK